MRVDIPMPSRFKIEDLFRDNCFVVPVYQRNYAWGKSEVGDFWEDLKDLVKGRRDSHFFGQIVTYRDSSGVQEIIDGQQRLTTSVIFMAAVRDIANEMYEKNTQNSNGSVSLEVSDLLRDIRLQVEQALYRDDDQSPTLVVEPVADRDGNTRLQDFFDDLISSNKKALMVKTTSKPIKDMQTAYKDMTDWIRKMLKEETSIGDQIDLLRKIFLSFSRRFYLVMISAPSRRDAFTIFETLNSRGKDLAPSDIIKNHLMSTMENNIEESNEMWGELAEYLNNDSKRITRFIRTYWASKERIVSTAKLYREVSDCITDVNSAKDLLTDLENLVQLYVVLESPTTGDHRKYFSDQRIMQRLDIFSRINVKLYYPIVIAMSYRNYKDDDILMVVNKLLSIFIRHRTIINDGTNTLEVGFSEIAKNIWNLNYQGVDRIIDGINSKMLKSNEETKASFSVLRKDGGDKGRNKWVLAYILSEIYNNRYEGLSEDELYGRVFDDDCYRVVQISNDNKLSEYSKNIGNWTIIEKSLVKSGFSDIYEAERKLKSSELKANQELADIIREHGWGVTEINKRQAVFANDAVNVW